MMKNFLLITIWAILSTSVRAQEISAGKWINMVSMTTTKAEDHLRSKKFIYRQSYSSGDTLFKTYEYTGSKKKKGNENEVERKCVVSTLKGSSALTFHTSSEDEYRKIITGLRKEGFYCEYETDSTAQHASYLYQYKDMTADASIKKVDTSTTYSICFYKKTISPENMLETAEDLLEFSSHEYLVYFFGSKNVKKDLYYFADNDIVNCSVLFMNTNRQVIFVWKDPLNRRKIANLLFGGQHNLKSQQANDNVIAENSWKLKSGLKVGMPLMELRILNDNNIAFCGGKAPNPGLVLPESSGNIDFRNADVVLGCVNCNDDKFLAAQKLNSDRAMDDGRILFVLSIVLYPEETVKFD